MVGEDQSIVTMALFRAKSCRRAFQSKIMPEGIWTASKEAAKGRVALLPLSMMLSSCLGLGSVCSLRTIDDAL